MVARARKANESYKQYRASLVVEDVLLKQRLKGTLVYNSALRDANGVRIPAMQVGTREKPEYMPFRKGP